MTTTREGGSGRLRIASLLPAATEIVCALGMREALVGVSHECDHPPGVKTLPVLTRSKIPASRTSAGIDRGVRELASGALAVYEVELEALAAARPDVIVTQDLCDVCAVSLDEVREAVAQVVPGARIVALKPQVLADIWKDIERVGEALGCRERADELIASLLARIDAVARRAARQVEHPHVLTIEWIDPVMVGGTWMPELVELAGGRPLVTRPGERAPTLGLEELQALEPAPEVVLVKPCGFTLARSEMELETLNALLRRMPWPAALVGDMYLADGNAYFNRPGPRIVDSLEILAACVHPFEFRDLAGKHAPAYVRLAVHGSKDGS